ncbi:MAG: hypothetical protein SF066_14635 [Thermoanaerobaculia bacterium]|nr:hypothetical protein [Thermoanaerobaculia bacterium]
MARSGLGLWAVGAAVFLLALGVRELRPHTQPAALLGPRPDSLEYVAGAQAIVQDGRYFLQVGPDAVRPRYPPGFSLLLAPALAVGVPPPALWRVTAFYGAALAVLVGVVAAGVVRHLRPGHPGTQAAALALAGGLWAVTPAAVAVGRAVLSDEPATLFWLLTLVLALRAVRAPTVGIGAACGVVWALTLAIRPVVAVPAGLVLAPLGFALLRDRAGAARRTLLAAAGGAAAVVAGVIALLLHSGLPAWPWDGYQFWLPERHGVPGGVWSLDYALRGDPHVPRLVDGAPIGSLEFVARAALGLPGLATYDSAGPFWPTAGLVLLALALGHGATRRKLAGPVRGLAWGLALWVVFQVGLYGGYFFCSARFLLPLLALFAVAFGAGAAVIGSRSRVALVAVGLVALGASGATAYQVHQFESLRPRRVFEVPSAVVVESWLARSDAERAGMRVPFDPVHAQALGLLPPRRLEAIREWGELPDTVHVRRLRRRAN